MNSALNRNTTRIVKNFKLYWHNFFGTVANYYDSLDHEGKNALRLMETSIATFKNYVTKSTLIFSRKPNFEKRATK